MPHPQGCINAGHESLAGCLFIAGGAVDLAGKKQAGDGLGLQPGVQVAGVEIIVLDGITGTGDAGLLKAFDRAYQIVLHVVWQAGGYAVRIDFRRGQSLRFDKDLVGGPVGEAHDLVFHRRAVTRADAFNRAAVHGRAVQAGADDVMGAFVGMGDVA